MKPGRIRLSQAVLDGLERVVVFAVSLRVCLEAVGRTLAIHADTVRHLLLAKDCLAGNACHLRLGLAHDASELGVVHGAVFSDYLVLVQWLGGDLAAARLFLAVLTSVALVLLYELVRRLAGRALAATAVLVMLWHYWFTGFHALLWNPTLGTLPAVLFLFAAYRLLRTQKTAYLLLAAATVGLGLQVHLAFGLALLPLGLLVAWRPRGARLTAVVVAALVVAASVELVSPAMVLDVDRGVLARVPRAAWLLAPVGAAAWVGLVAIVRRRLAPFETLLLAAYLVPFVVLLAAAPHEGRYHESLLPGVVAFGAGLAARLGRRWWRSPLAGLRPEARTAAVAAALLLLGLGGMAPAETQHGPSEFTMAEAERLAEHVQTRGLSYAEVFRRLRGGSGYWQLLNGLAYYLPATRPDGATRAALEAPALSVFMAAGGAAPAARPGWTFLATPGRGLLLHEYAPWLRWDAAEVCLVTPARPQCVLAPLDLKPARDAGAPWLLAARALPQAKLPTTRETPFQLLLKVPVRIPAGAAGRAVLLPGVRIPGPGPPERLACAGRVSDLEGVRRDGRLPARTVVLRGAAGAQEGAVLLSWEFGTPTCSSSEYRRLPPPVVEVAEDDLGYLARYAAPREHRVPDEGRPPARRYLLRDLAAAPAARPAARSPEPRQPTVGRGYAVTVTLALALGALLACVACLAGREDDHREQK